MAVVNSYLALHLLPLLPLLLLLLVATNEGTTFNITNQCSYTVWPAAVPGGGMQLDPEKSWTLDVPANATGGRMWARTGCSFDDKGNGSCQTGDCSGMLACKGYGQPPSTLAEFSRFGIGQKDYFHISLVYGFNVPMDFQPVPTREGPGCSKGPRCTANITSQCPSELTVPGGCNNTCTVFKQEKYCCLGNTCEPNNTYSVFFGETCLDASNAGLNNMFDCPQGTNYQVIFCPPVNSYT